MFQLRICFKYNNAINPSGMEKTLYEYGVSDQLDMVHSVSTENDVFKCDTCNKTYVSFYCIERHISIHVTAEEIRCIFDDNSKIIFVKSS